MAETNSAIERAPSQMERAEFVAKFGSVFEHSAWIAERAFDAGVTLSADTARGLHDLMAGQFDAASDDEKTGVLTAHPDLAGKLAAAKRLTAESTLEQAGAGLDALTDDEKASFSKLNETYTSKFSFPFIIAVKGLNKADILHAFETRINNDQATEFATACKQVERIALLRLLDLLPHEASS